MGKDLLDDRFGRFWELPLELARRGHEVQGITLSYRAKKQWFSGPVSTPDACLRWHNVNLLHYGVPTIHGYLRHARRILTEFQPEIIWACSDAFHAILGVKIARQSDAKCVIDLYDNFDSYPATKIPGVLSLFKRAIAVADGITCISNDLVGYLQHHYRIYAPILILENAIRADLFYPMERDHCRAQFGLPLSAKIIGMAGALHRSRGVVTLYRGFDMLKAENPALHLAVAGPRTLTKKIPSCERAHDLGVLPLERVPAFLNALDVAVICNRDSMFGRYNFPQKAREIIACQIPLVAARTGVMGELLRDYPECLFAPDDPTNLACAVRTQLKNRRRVAGTVPSWADLAVELENFFQSTLHHQK